MSATPPPPVPLRDADAERHKAEYRRAKAAKEAAAQ
jgi:hypothetical protein